MPSTPMQHSVGPVMGRRFNTNTIVYMRHQEQSHEIVPPTPQELARHRDPRRATLRWGRSGPSLRGQRTDLSAYEVPITPFETGATAGGSNIPAVIPLPAPSTAVMPSPSAPSAPLLGTPAPPGASTSALATSAISETPAEDAVTNANTKMRQQPDEEEGDDGDGYSGGERFEAPLLEGNRR
ncbi:hypothetical protein BYT27DRAFT_7260887 [Phlegmacium glaucopus]|nr:hypothetical protein BYT27DRAFT_7260887 [Phlegmacium glaucopus]